MKKDITSKKDAKITLNTELDKFKDIKFKSGKPEEIKKLRFKLSF